MLRSALSDGGLLASDVSKLEMHGTGTALGDPIESYAAMSVFMGAGAAATARKSPVVLTALKSHMGHAEPAAGGCLGKLKQTHTHLNWDKYKPRLSLLSR